MKLMTDAEMERLDADARRLLETYGKGEHTSLLAEVDQLSKRGSLSAGVLGLAAASLIAMERYEEAATAARGAVAKEPQWAWLHLALSRAEQGRGDWARAAEAARLAVQFAPGEPLYLANLAECYRLTGQVDRAIRTAEEALALDPAHLESLNQLGLALEAAGDQHGAIDQFRKAQAVSPADPAAYLNEGMLHRRAGRIDEARRAFREALRRNPGLAEAEDLLVECLCPGPLLQRVAHHLLTLARLSVVGWAIVAFLYYLLFRLLEFLWKHLDFMLPVGRVLLVATLVWLLGGAAAGWLLRWLVRRLP